MIFVQRGPGKSFSFLEQEKRNNSRSGRAIHYARTIKT